MTHAAGSATEGGGMGRALVLAGGGITGIAWESGVLAGLAAGGVDTQDWDLVVGTSAGAFVGARLALDGAPEPLFERQASAVTAADIEAVRVVFGSGFARTVRWSRRPRLRWVGVVWLANLIVTSVMRYAVRNGFRSTVSLAKNVRRARQEGDWQRIAALIGAVCNADRRRSTALADFWERDLGREREWPEMRLVTTAVDTADGSRALMDGTSSVSLVGAIAASTCLPGFLPPIALRGRRYIDGGLASAANADVASGHEEVWIVSPFGAPSLDQQVSDLRASGSVVHLIRPSTAAEDAIGPGPGVMDLIRRSAAARAGFEDGRTAALGVSKLTREVIAGH
jgi:NTE family protein